MGFDIPMNTSGTFTTDSLVSINNGALKNGGTAQGQPMQPQQVQPQQNLNQANMQFSQPGQPMNAQPFPQGQVGQSNQGVTPIKQRPQGNGVILKKGQKVNLAPPGGGALQNIQVCLGWDLVNQACDLDVSAFMLGVDGRVLGDDWFVFYGQPVSPDASITHSGDSNGESYGDDEIITINLQSINQNCKKVVFVVTIDEALTRGLNFSMVANAYVRVVDTTTGNELVKFTLTDYYANVTSMVVGEVYNHNGQWKFSAVGDGVAKDLAGLCAMYGVNVAG